MRILVMSAQYPSSDNLYANMFVHVRVLRYMALGEDVRVISFFTDRPSYQFEGVAVICVPDLESLTSAIGEFAPDVVAIHFFQGWMLRKIVLKTPAAFVIWVHAIEAMWWFRRLFNFEVSREFYDYVKFNIIQVVRLRKLFKFAENDPGKVRFVFVSEWIRRVAETDTGCRVTSAEVIPNPIDTARFPYVAKDATHRTRVLLIRPFNSRKYANDIAVEAIRRFSRYPEFDQFKFTIHGRGKLFAPLTQRLSHFRNVFVHEGFITHEEIRVLHESHGILLCPTRQDSQGVSMCEAMSSGLVPITSDSSAIPEFVGNGRTGFLTKGSEDIVAALRQVYHDADLFLMMSKAAAEDIRRKCGADDVVQRELSTMREAVAAFGATA